MSRKEGETILTRIEDSEYASIQGLEHYIKIATEDYSDQKQYKQQNDQLNKN